MNHSEIEIEDLSAILAYISYLNNKIREGSEILGENLDSVSNELVDLVNEAVAFDTLQPQMIPVKAA